MIFKDMDELRRHLKIGMPLPSYFIGGSDTQRKRTILNKIVKITTEGGTGFDTHRFSGNVSADTVADAAFEITFGGGRRAVVCEDIPFSSMAESEYKKFEQLVTEVAELSGSTVLIFMFDTVETENKPSGKKDGAQKKNKIEFLKKIIDKTGGGVIKCEYPSNAELSAMIDKTCGKYHCEIHRDLCAYMIERCGSDSALLQNEAKKLAEYKGQGNITKEDIDLMTCATPDAKIFDLYTKIAARDRKGAFSVLDDLKEMGEPAPVILSVLTSNYVDLFRAKAARAEGKTKFDMAKDFPKSYSGKRDFIAQRAINAQGYYSGKALSECLNVLLSAEIKMKSTGIDSMLILDETVARLFSIK